MTRSIAGMVRKRIVDIRRRAAPLSVGLLAIFIAKIAKTAGSPADDNFYTIVSILLTAWAIGLAYAQGDVSGQSRWATRMLALILSDRSVEITVTHEPSGQTINLQDIQGDREGVE